MKIPHFLFCAALVAAFSFVLSAQQPQSGFYTVACIKAKPDKTSEFRQWTTEVLHKYAQGRVDSGALSTFLLLRGVFPAGTSAECDYLTVAMYPGVPPEPLGMDEMSAALKKAGLNMSAEEYISQRKALSTLVSSSLFHNESFAGDMKKGAYMEVNYMKTSDVDKWVDFEKKKGKPLAEEFIKAGRTMGWSANVQWYPYGSNLPSQGVTVDVFPSWDALYKDYQKVFEEFNRAHPDLAMNPEEAEKIRTQAVVQLFKVEDMINAAK